MPCQDLLISRRRDGWTCLTGARREPLKDDRRNPPDLGGAHGLLRGVSEVLNGVSGIPGERVRSPGKRHRNSRKMPGFCAGEPGAWLRRAHVVVDRSLWCGAGRAPVLPHRQVKLGAPSTGVWMDAAPDTPSGAVIAQTALPARAADSVLWRYSRTAPSNPQPALISSLLFIISYPEGHTPPAAGLGYPQWQRGTFAVAPPVRGVAGNSPLRG